MKKKDKEPEPKKACETCLYWDENAWWCDEYEDYGNPDRIWSCERWVDKHVYGG